MVGVVAAVAGGALLLWALKPKAPSGLPAGSEPPSGWRFLLSKNVVRPPANRTYTAWTFASPNGQQVWIVARLAGSTAWVALQLVGPANVIDPEKVRAVPAKTNVQSDPALLALLRQDWELSP